MVDTIPTGLAVLAVGLGAVALVFMSTGRLALAGVTFLCVSLIIYFRERYLGRGR